jgi:hypothetical protein
VPIWDPRRLDAGGCYEVKLGLLTVWIKHTYQDWYVASEIAPFRSRKELLLTYMRSVKAEPPSWRRWVFGEGTGTVALAPRTPDRSVVVEPDLPLRIPPGQKALFFVTIPLWVAVTVGEAERFTLCELPTTELSRTWFGDFASGELCYSLRSRAKRVVERAERAVHSAVCPVEVTNASSAPLEFRHICIHSDHLSIYHVPGRMWTNRVNVVYEGGDHESQVTMVESAPDIEGEASLVSPARQAAQHSLMRKSFRILRMLTGI